MNGADMSSLTTATPAKTPALSKRAEKILTIFMAVMSPLLLIGLLEGIAYVWERAQANGPYAWELVASRRLQWERRTEPGAGFTVMKPNSHYEWQSIPVDINSHGLRGPETTYDKPPDTYRILNLGDSVAMGWGVRVEDTYGQQLQSWLNEHKSDDLHYEVINAGVPGWNLENALAYLQAEGLRYQPDLVLLDLTIVNDIRGRSALLADNQPAQIKWLRDHTYFWPFLTVQLRWMQARAQGEERIDVLDPPTEAEKYFPLDPDDEQFNAIWKQISAIRLLAADNNADIALIVFPLEFQVLDDSYPTTAQEVFMAKAAEAGIPALDLLPRFQQACLEKPGGACQLEDRYLFADVWMHPSALGHNLTATELQRVITEMLPQ